MTLIHHFLENSAAHFPDKCALVHENRRASYSEINREANQIADYLIRSGVTVGDRVVILVENSIEYVVSYYGILKAGGVAVPLNPELKPESLEPLLAELGARVVIATNRQEAMLLSLSLGSLGVGNLVIRSPQKNWSIEGLDVISWDEVKNSGCSENPKPLFCETDLASIIYTSGSTGKPKGAMLTHRNIVANTRSIVEYLELAENDIQMVVLPFFYVMGKSLLNTHFAVGGRVVINNKFAFPATVVNQMVKEKVTGFSGVPSTYAYLLHRSPLAARRDDLASLRYCSQAGGHLDRTTKQKLLQVLPSHTKMFVMYGATEASARLSYVEPHRLNEKIDSIGRAIPGVTLKVLDENGQELENGQVGEIVACGENIMQGYWKDPESTAVALSSDGYHTGDLGYRDQDGYFFVEGRKDNQFKVGGHKVSTQEIEDAILSTGLVVEVVVLGIPDPLLGNKLVALAVPSVVEPNDDQIRSLCTEKLPHFKVPHKIHFVKNLPKSPSGKVNRSQCLAIVFESS